MCYILFLFSWFFSFCCCICFCFVLFVLFLNLNTTSLPLVWKIWIMEPKKKNRKEKSTRSFNFFLLLLLYLYYLAGIFRNISQKHVLHLYSFSFPFSRILFSFLLVVIFWFLIIASLNGFLISFIWISTTHGLVHGDGLMKFRFSIIFNFQNVGA